MKNTGDKRKSKASHCRNFTTIRFNVKITDIYKLIFCMTVCGLVFKLDSAFGHYFRLWLKQKHNYKSSASFGCFQQYVSERTSINRQEQCLPL